MRDVVFERGALVARPTAAAGLGMALGWLGVGLGVAALLMPRRMANASGLDGRTRMMRAVGLRELATGAGILLRPHKPGWLWSRVAGDAMDLGLLAYAGRRSGGERRDGMRGEMRGRRVALASALVAGITVLDMLAAYDNQRVTRAGQREAPGSIRVRKSLNINRTPEECYRFWRNFENFPSFMQHVDEVHSIDATRSHWKVRAPLGQHVEWTAELASDVPSQQLGWRTLEGSGIDHAGVVRFAPGIGGRGTRVQVDLSYRAPLGKAGAQLAKLFGEEPSQQIEEDLRRFKQLIETGEIPTTIGQPAGQRSLLGRMVHKGLPG